MAGRRLVKPRLRRGHYADEVMETQRREHARRKTGEFLGRLRHPDGSPIEIDGLWALRFGNGVTGNPTTLLFTAGIDGEAHGLFGAIDAAS